MLFVDWRSVNALFCGLIWLVAVALAVVILVHRLPIAPAGHHLSHAVAR